MYKNKKSRKNLHKIRRIKHRTMQKRLRKSMRGGRPAPPPPPPFVPPPPPLILNYMLVLQVPAEIARLNLLLGNNNIQGRLYLRLILLYFTTVLDNYTQSSNNNRGNEMVNLLNQMLGQSQNVIVGITVDAIRQISRYVGNIVLIAHGDEEMYN